MRLIGSCMDDNFDSFQEGLLKANCVCVNHQMQFVFYFLSPELLRN